MLIPFAIRTIIIYKMSAEYVGVGSLFTSILQILSVTELGFASAITFSLYAPVSKNDTSTIIQTISVLKSIYKVIGAIILVIGLCLMPFLKFFIKDTVPDDINIYILFAIYLSNTVVTYFLFGYKNSILSVYQRYDVISKINTFIELCKGGVQIIILLTTKNYYLYIIMLPVFTIISSFLTSYITNKLHPELNVKTKFSFKGIGELKKQIFGIAIGRISLVCRNSFDSIIISSLFGLTITAIYSNYYLIFTSVTSFLLVMITSMAASVGNSLVTESLEKNENDHMRFDFYYMFLTGLCTICMFSLYQPFMELWVGEELTFGYITMMLFCIYFYVNGLSQVRSVYSEAAGLWWHFRYFSIADMVANLALNFILGFTIGVNGIIIATIITAVLHSFIIVTIITYKKLFKINSTHYFIYNLLYMIYVALICLASHFLLRNVDFADGWVGLIIKAIVVASVGGISLLLLNMISKRTRNYVFDFFKMIRRSKNV